MPISCHFQDCKALLVLKKHEGSAIASTWTLLYLFIKTPKTNSIRPTVFFINIRRYCVESWKL